MVAVEVIKKVKGRLPRQRIHKAFLAVRRRLQLNRRQHLTVVVVSPREIQELNQTYRHKPGVTDVLSFTDFDDPDYLGDVVICYDRVRRQAKEKSHSTEREFVILFIHGLLHLLGYDHEKDAEAEVMEGIEKQILSTVYKQ